MGVLFGWGWDKQSLSTPFQISGSTIVINLQSHKLWCVALVMSPKRGFGHHFRSCLEVSEQVLRHMSLATLDFVKYPKRGPNRAHWLYVPNSVDHFRGHQYETLVSRVDRRFRTYFRPGTRSEGPRRDVAFLSSRRTRRFASCRRKEIPEMKGGCD